ncbi:uncharacterized protein BX664DRAFT_338212 [Halteromyces radiatus]|uniref:uncharacterized protein n=1 Tax=Halteromyces radiatus TaxID=101107 RepID=UPI00221F21AA|nr:uncharacterized protein BX664DRAFT_338212 [Halteromyces radiatus]KAI8084967.1 hypothetical protein BX664DRAFT_338212 [Halteromyces radiatus]
MDTSPINQSFPQNAPFRQPVTILHFVSLTLAYLIFYPYIFTQKSSKHAHKRRWIVLCLGFSFASVGSVTGWFIQYSPTSSSWANLLHIILGQILFILSTLQTFLDYTSTDLLCHRFQDTHYHQQQHEQQHSILYNIFSWTNHIPKYAIIFLQWIILYLGYFHLIFSILVLTSTCNSLAQCWLSLATGTGFLVYGSLIFMHLVNIISLPRRASPEHYEALWIFLWGCLSFFLWDTNILGSSWKAIHLGLLWTTGGLLSLMVSLQSWSPFLQKRNIVNSVIICLTGKAILSAIPVDDTYVMELHSTLGYVCIVGGMARCIQITFRKSPVDNLPRLYSRASGASDENCDDDIYDDDTCVDELDIGQRRANDFEATYRQLVGMELSSSSSTTSSCKHQSVYASITMVCGLICCFMAISGGFLFIGTTVDWMEIMQYYINDPSIYVNLLLAISFIWLTYLLILCTLYKNNTTRPGSYDYLDLATGDYCELPLSSKATSSPNSSFDHHRNSNMMTTSTSSSSTPIDNQQQSMFTSIPLLPLKQHASNRLSGSNSNGTTSSPPPMRPSQYRAKRRSLLISTGMQNNNQQDNRTRRTLSASSHTGVGGILPDEVLGDYSFSPTVLTATSAVENTSIQLSNDHPRCSWRSGSSSLSSSSISSSSSSSSASTTGIVSSPRISSSTVRATTTSTNSIVTTSTLSHRDSWQQVQQHDNDHQIESGKRQWKKSKQRRTTNTTSFSNDEQDDEVSSSGSSDDRSRKGYYSSERNSIVTFF